MGEIRGKEYSITILDKYYKLINKAKISQMQ